MQKGDVVFEKLENVLDIKVAQNINTKWTETKLYLNQHSSRYFIHVATRHTNYRK